jgi:hypothetical protein
LVIAQWLVLVLVLVRMVGAFGLACSLYRITFLFVFFFTVPVGAVAVVTTPCYTGGTHYDALMFSTTMRGLYYD